MTYSAIGLIDPFTPTIAFRYFSSVLSKIITTTAKSLPPWPRALEVDICASGIEYWQFADPSILENFKACNSDGEDPQCSAQLIFQGVLNPAHFLYYDIPFQTQRLR
ncbi:hypothetical protein HGRIS_000462 [Hohenbuehelia grisea]|uniref:Uncharacterized protein n=1 Tax=Hohenbuehelia grisea TaxID=104357 RepID=A0ABR3JRA8_9AGAR